MANRTTLPVCFALLFIAEPIIHSSPWAALWTAPCILFASVVITWGAESAQFFLAQGFALAILALMQTLPEFGVEAVLAWKQQTPLLLANLTGALRLLTGLAWPMIYITAAVVHRRRTKKPLKSIKLDPHQSVEVVGLFFPLVYALFIWAKASVHLFDGAVLILIYLAYLFLLSKLPPQEKEAVEELERIPRSIVLAPKRWRILAITACFLTGGALIYLAAEPFLGSLIALATAVGIPTFLAIQWLAPVISEFPELLSTFYFARQEENASIAVMNIASSNINQWTLLFAMLPIVFSISRHSISAIPLDPEQQKELLLTIGQGMVALIFLLNMEFDWWEALAMFVLFAAQFIDPAAKHWITLAFFVWTGVEVLRLMVSRRVPAALVRFTETWRALSVPEVNKRHTEDDH